MIKEDNADRVRVLRLTEKQRDCMRLVVMRKSSKEIARELGIAKPTVDQRIANARQILGARNRDDAANIFARHAAEYDRIIYDPARVPRFVDPDQYRCQEMQKGVGLRLEEAAFPSSGNFEHQPSRLQYFLGRHPGDLGAPQRLLAIAGMTVGILSAILIGLAVAQSLSDLLTSP